MQYDVLVIGGGIAGMETSLTLGDMGYKILLIEKEASIGGKMVLLSKVFPTLDCASCIATPKMAATANHENITILPYSEVDEIEQEDNGHFRVRLHRKPTFIDSAACTGCAQCELVCTVAIPDQFNKDLISRRAAHIAFPQAVPKKAIIDHQGSSPCTYACPAGVKAHGYVSLVRAGRHEQAFHLHMEDAPLPGSLSRACYAPCEGKCTRAQLEGSVSIRGIKRFMVDRYYGKHSEPEYGPPDKSSGKAVAVIGSGPAGLTASYFLARKGHRVEIFEAASQAGGMLRYGIPPYRLPKSIVDRDIKNITALGVKINTDSPISSIPELKDRGFDVIFVGTGTLEGYSMNLPGENLDDVMDCMRFLRGSATGYINNLSGKNAVIIGGGNSAIDPARTALRLGAEKVSILYRRSRAEMPAHDWEVQAALDEGVKLHELKMPVRFIGNDGHLQAIECLDMTLGMPDDSGRRRPIPINGSEKNVAADIAILSIGLRPATSNFSRQLDLESNERIKVNRETLATSIPGVFAGGDVVTGPSMIIEAIGQGKRAAFYIDRFLMGKELNSKAFDQQLPMVEPQNVLRNGGGKISRRKPLALPQVPLPQRVHNGIELEVEGTMDEEHARYSANRCLDCGGCSECHECVSACPANAVHFEMRREDRDMSVSSVVLATGFELFDPRRKPAYGYGRFPNVIDAMQMDRLLAPTRPYNAVVRPSDGKVPSNIAFALCTGSRDEGVGNRLCSQICCMYSLKQAQLAMGALPLADITIYYIDIRAFGKGYEEFYEQAKGMGVYFVKGRIGRIEETADQNLNLFYEDILNGGGIKKAEHDLVVLSVGLLPNTETLSLFSNRQLESETIPFVREIDPHLEPCRTSIDGIFVAGAASAARDIPDSIMHAGAAAAQTAAYLKKVKAQV